MDDCNCECENDEEETADEEPIYEIEGGAGWMYASATGDSPDEAYEIWEEMWDKMIKDVEKMSHETRLQAGVRQ